MNVKDKIGTTENRIYFSCDVNIISLLDRLAADLNLDARSKVVKRALGLLRICNEAEKTGGEIYIKSGG